MSDEQELKLACLHQAGGNLDHAKSLFDWVSGSVRATPASEAPAVSAPNQDKPEQPFNYQHPSKYGTDVPRRCYLEELTPEERTIRDLVDAVERLGAHPLLTATVIQLMKAGESLADWVDIGLRDKAIAALTSEPETHTGDGGEEFLLDEGQQETSPVQSASDQDKLRQEDVDKYKAAIKRADTATDKEIDASVRALQEKDRQERIDDFKGRYPGFTKPPLPEGFLPWSGGECPVPEGTTVEGIFCSRSGSTSRLTFEWWTGMYAGGWAHALGVDSIIAYRVITDAERTSDESQAELATEQTLITDDIPSIPREEIPIGAAVETYTDSGIETVKLAGTTYVVDDEPAPPVAEAAYAPVNEDEGLMWSNGFEADARAKAEPEQDKRPFWMFAKKELA